MATTNGCSAASCLSKYLCCSKPSNCCGGSDEQESQPISITLTIQNLCNRMICCDRCNCFQHSDTNINVGGNYHQAAPHHVEQIQPRAAEIIVDQVANKVISERSSESNSTIV
jgi:hypothetical protein